MIVVGPAVGLRGDLAAPASVDAYGTWWFQWFAANALAEGNSLLRTDLLFHPWGKDILRHTGANLADAVALAPVRWLLGPVVAWNALYAAAIAGNAAAAGLCTLARGHERWAAIAATVVAGLHPYALYELQQGRPTQALLAPLLIALFAGERALDLGGARRIATAGAALALTGGVYWFAGLFGAVALAVLGLRRPLRLTGIAAVSFALTSPVVLPLMAALGRGDVPGVLPLAQWWAGDFSLTNAEGDTVRLATLDGWGRAIFQGSHSDLGQGRVLGITSVGLMLFAPGRWRILGLVAALIAAGPFVGGMRNPVYLAAAELLPPMERLYWPVRAAGLFVAVGAIGAAAAVSRIGRWVLPVASAAMLAEAVAAGQLPLGSWRLPDAASWKCLDGGAVIALPYGYDQLPLVHQTLHGRPMLGGMHERSKFLVPPEQIDLRRRNAWLRAVLLAPADPRDESAWTESDRTAVGALGYRWIVLRSQPLDDAPGRFGSATHRLRDAKRRLTALAGEPVFDREGLVIWAPWGHSPACDPSSPPR